MIKADANILNYFNIFNIKIIISKKEIINSFRVTTVRICKLINKAVQTHDLS
jgi:hypothetical protein